MSLFCDCRTDCVEHTAETELCCVLGFLFFVRATTTDSIFRTYGSHSRGRSHAPTRAIKLVLVRLIPLLLFVDGIVFIVPLSSLSHMSQKSHPVFLGSLASLCGDNSPVPRCPPGGCFSTREKKK